METAKRKHRSIFQRANIYAAFARQKTRAVIRPFKQPEEKGKLKKAATIMVYDFDEKELRHTKPHSVTDCFHYHQTPTITWINMDGLDKHQMESICNHFGVHQLIQEDIVHYGQRPKIDEIDNVIFVVLNMLFFDAQNNTIEQEQISIVLTNNTILSFQEDAARDVFDPIRKRLNISNSKERTRGADYLFYSLIDLIADSYLSVIEQLGLQIELLEEQIITKSTKTSFERISQLRKDIILLKRNVVPVKDLVSGLIRTDNKFVQKNTAKYFKDISDHVTQAGDLIDNYRDLLFGLQDLYVNNVNLRMNEVMKTLAIMTAVMAPATVIGSVFGMNFEIIPYSKHKWGFYGTVIIMVIIPIYMIIRFKKRGWFEKDYPGA